MIASSWQEGEQEHHTPLTANQAERMDLFVQRPSLFDASALRKQGINARLTLEEPLSCCCIVILNAMFAAKLVPTL